MATTRKKPAKPGDNDGGVRVERASDRPKQPKASDGTTWLNPREPLPDSVTAKMLDSAGKVKPAVTLVEAAQAAAGEDRNATLLSAIIIAQALDRLGEKIITAAAVSRGGFRGP